MAFQSNIYCKKKLLCSYLQCIRSSLSEKIGYHTNSGARRQPGKTQPGNPTTWKDKTQKDKTRKRHNLEEAQPGRDITREGFNPEEDLT